MRENATFLDGVWDLTASREAGFAKIGMWKGNGIWDSYYRSSGSATVVQRSALTGSGRPYSRLCSLIAFPEYIFPCNIDKRLYLF